jgi:hypothetical protein
MNSEQCKNVYQDYLKALKYNLSNVDNKHIIVTVKRIHRFPGNMFNPDWKLPMDVVVTDKGVFVSHPSQNDFSKHIGQTIPCYINNSKNLVWLSFNMNQLPNGLLYR